jgi:protein-disulfide isomerase
MLGFRRGKEATLAGECAADQGAFWPMHDALFADQDRWRRGRRPDEEFEAMAGDLGLDVEVFAECVDRDTPRRRIEASNDAADELAVRATPAFFIDGRPVLGALSVEQFTALVEAAEAGRAGGES